MNLCSIAVKLEFVEQISGRLEITKILSGMFRDATPEQAQYLAYFLCGNLAPCYKNFTFNIADRQMLNFLYDCLSETQARDFHDYVGKVGDLGQAYFLALTDGGRDVCGKFCLYGTKIGLEDLFEKLKELSEVSGSGAVQTKRVLISRLLETVCPLGAKYVIRVILGKLRLGFSEMTVLDALSWMQEGSKKLKAELEKAFNLSADIGLLA